MNKVRDREQIVRPVSNENAEPELTAFENAPTQEPPEANATLEASTIQMKTGPSVQGGMPFRGEKGSSGLPADIQAKAEAALAIDLSGITLVENSNLAAKIGALAFVRGREMHFAPGQYQPNTEYGRSIIYHEIGHMAPAGKADTPTTEIAGLPVNNDPGKEALADALGRLAARYALPKAKQSAATKAEGSETIQPKLDVTGLATPGMETKDAKRAARRLKTQLNGLSNPEDGMLPSVEHSSGPDAQGDQPGMENLSENAQGMEADTAGPDGGGQAVQEDRQVSALDKAPMLVKEAKDEDDAAELEGLAHASMPVADQVDSQPPVEEAPSQVESVSAGGDSPAAGHGRVTKGQGDKTVAKQAAKAPRTVAPKSPARPTDADQAAPSDAPQAESKAKPKAKQPDKPLAPASGPTAQPPMAEEPAAKEAASAGKGSKGKSTGPKAETKATAGEESTNAGPKRPKTAADDPEFQGVVQHVAASAETQATHDAPEADVEAVEGAAVLPQSDQKGEGDRKAHLEGMEGEAEKPKRFEAATFKEKLKANLTQLEAKLPKDSDEAEKFKKDKPIDDVKDGIQKDVQGEKEKISGPLEKQAKKATPPPAGLPTTPEVPLQAKKLGKAPAQLNAAAAIPKRLDDQEISLEAESGKLDDMMAQGELTDEQLAKSNEPTFLGALESKNAAKAKAKAAPGEYRGKEAEQLKTAKGQANAAGQKGLVGMHEVRLEKLQTVQKAQKGSETKQEQERAKVKAQFTAIYDKTKTAVMGKLEELSTQVTQLFDTEAESAKKTFEKNVEERLDKIYGWTRLDDLIFGEDKEAIAEAFRLEKETFIQTMDKVLDRISVIIADGLNAAMDLIAAGRDESKAYYDSLDATLKAASKEDFDAFNGQYDALEESVREKENELAQGLAQSYEQNVAGLEATFEEIKQQVSASWIDGAIESIKGVIDTIKKLREMFNSLLSGAIAAIEAILSDPIGFLSNLIDGVKQGFLNFGANIQQHLMTGLVEWLTGTLSGAGITVPEDVFSLGGIFNLSMQVMGLTYDYFRGKAVNLLGEPVVAGLETTVELFNAYRAGGAGALWEEVKDQFGDIKEVVIDAIKDMVITQVMNAGIKWIMGLLSPVGAFIKAAMAIVDLVQFFMQRAAQIMELVQAFIQGIRAIAAGNVAAMAAAIERALGRAVPVLIGFLASLLGLGDLSSKVEKIIGKIRKRIDKEIERVIKKMVKFAKNVGKKVKNVVSKDKDGAQKEEGKPDVHGLTPEDKKKHQQIGKAIEQKMRKTDKKGKAKEFEQLHAEKKQQASELEQAYQPQLKPNIKLTITLGDVGSDKADGDIDVKVRIAPNDFEVKFEVDGVEDVRFKKLAYQAIEEVARIHYKGGNVNDFRKTQEDRKLGGNEVSIDKKEEEKKRIQEQKKADKAAAKKKAEKEALTIHEQITLAQAQYKRASEAQYVPNNMFRLGKGSFFVETADNFYILPGRIAKGFRYKFLSPLDKIAENVFKEQFKNRGATREEAKQYDSPTSHDGKFEQVSFMLRNKDKVDKNTRKGLEDSGLAIEHPDRNKYGYDAGAASVAEAKEFLDNFPNKITENRKSVLFLGAMLAEPTRYSPGYIGNLLLLNQDSELNDASKLPIQSPDEKLEAKKELGKYKSSGAYEHLPTTFSGSQPGSRKSKEIPKDGDLGYAEPNDPNLNVTNRTLMGLKQNASLLKDMEEAYVSRKAGEDSDIVGSFVILIEKRLGLKKEGGQP